MARSRHSALAWLLGTVLPGAAACRTAQPPAAADAGIIAAQSGSAGSQPQRDAALPDAAPPTRADADGGELDAGASGLSLQQAQQAYPGWSKRTAQPQAISAEIFSLCRLPSLAEQRFVDSKHGQVELLLLDWLNDAALRGFAAHAQPAFAVGSAIVKQKLRVTAAGQQEVAALGLMIKRAPGFDAAHGDWEYGYWEPSSGPSSGHESQTYCGDCHKGSATDHVFLDQSWRVPP